MITLGNSHRLLGGGKGSISVTARPAPAKRPESKDWTKSDSTTTGPRATLTRIAPGCSSAKRRLSNRLSVSGVHWQQMNTA